MNHLEEIMANEYLPTCTNINVPKSILQYMAKKYNDDI